MARTINLETDKGNLQDLTLLGQKHSRRDYYVLTSGRPAVLTLYPAQPFGGHWREEPFPECALTGVRRARLIPPPCRSTQAEVELLMNFASQRAYRGCKTEKDVIAAFLRLQNDRGISLALPELWELAWGGGVCLAPTDDALLAKCIAEEKEQASKKLELILQEIDQSSDAAGVKLQMRKSAQQCFGARSTVTLAMVKGEVPMRPPESLSEASARSVSESIRNEYLRKSWAKDNGVNLDEMQRESKWFEQFINERVWTQTVRALHALDERTPETYGERILSLDQEQWMVLKASVRYAADFKNGARVYLTAWDLRYELRPEEMSEVARYLPASLLQSAQRRPTSAIGKKRGRKQEYDHAADERLLNGWKAGHFRKYEDYSREKGMKTADLVRALQRARARRRYLARERQ
jgi:hypothetical protein